MQAAPLAGEGPAQWRCETVRKEIMGVSFDDVTLAQASAAGEELGKGPGCA